MTLSNLCPIGLRELFGLTILAVIGIKVAFMVMTMANGMESRAMSDLGIRPSTSAISGEAVSDSHFEQDNRETNQVQH